MKIKDCMCENVKWVTPETNVWNCTKVMQENKIGCRFLRGAGFGYIVGRFFEKPCRFSALHVAVRGWNEKSSRALQQP